MRNTRILLTGGSGMVGRNIVDLARQRQVEVIAPSHKELDLLDEAAVFGYLSKIRPDIVVHAAGRVGGIQANVGHPVAFLTENWDMGRNAVVAARRAGITRFVNLGSSCMYPHDRLVPLKEDDVLAGPLEPTNEGYAIAKCAIARLCEYVSREDLRFAYKTLIPCNIYGWYDHFEPHRSHLVAAVIHKLHEAKESGADVVEIWGDGTARREFLFAEDLADAVLAAVERFETVPSLVNIGTGTDSTVNEYYECAAKVVEFRGTFSHDLSKPAGMRRKLLDIRRAEEWGMARCNQSP